MIRRFVTTLGCVAVVVVSCTAVVQKEFPRNPWVQIDRTVSEQTSEPGPKLAANTPLKLTIEVPKAGLSRVDVRFHGVDTARDAAVRIEIRDTSTSKLIHVTDLALAIVPEDGTTSLLIPDIDPQRTASVRLDFTLVEAPLGARVSLWQFACDCIPTSELDASQLAGGANLPPTADLELATFTMSNSPRHRARFIRDRIDATRPGGFGATTILMAAGLSGAISIVGFVLLLQASAPPHAKRQKRHDASNGGRPHTHSAAD